jgi:hypothetical protein
MSTAKSFTRWRKASHSESGNECVEVGTSGRAIGVRDTKQAEQGPILEFAPRAFGRFVQQTKVGENDIR